FFFFQAEDGIRDFHVTGVQTCALPIFPTEGGFRLIAPGGCALPAAEARGMPSRNMRILLPVPAAGHPWPALGIPLPPRRARTYEIGRASCRERVVRQGAADSCDGTAKR